MLDKALKIIDSLNKCNVAYIIIGGYAIILHGFLRATEDIDLILKIEPRNISNLRDALTAIYNDNEIKEITFEELKNYPVIRYGTPDNFYIDIISGIGEAFSFDNIETITKVIDNVEIKFASVKSLYEMKKITYREKDKLDILFLKQKLENDKEI